MNPALDIYGATEKELKKIDTFLNGEDPSSIKDKDKVGYEFRQQPDLESQKEYIEGLYENNSTGFMASLHNVDPDLREAAGTVLKKKELEYMIGTDLDEGILDDGISYSVEYGGFDGNRLEVVSSIPIEEGYNPENIRFPNPESVAGRSYGVIIRDLYDPKNNDMLEDARMQMEEYADQVNFNLETDPQGNVPITYNTEISGDNFMETRDVLSAAIAHDMEDKLGDIPELYSYAFEQGDLSGKDIERLDGIINEAIANDPNLMDLARTHAKGVAGRTLEIGKSKGSLASRGADGGVEKLSFNKESLSVEDGRKVIDALRGNREDILKGFKSIDNDQSGNIKSMIRTGASSLKGLDVNSEGVAEYRMDELRREVAQSAIRNRRR